MQALLLTQLSISATTDSKLQDSGHSRVEAPLSVRAQTQSSFAMTPPDTAEKKCKFGMPWQVTEWWQSTPEGDSEARAGLRNLQESWNDAVQGLQVCCQHEAS